MRIPLLLALPVLTLGAGTDPALVVAEVLDTWHLAAARADATLYFDLMTPEAVFLGTDGTERWLREDFRKWAAPYFSKGKAWTFHAVSRNVRISKHGEVAWFDEVLETPNLGPARGSGVLVKTEKGWRIAQYNLSVPIPNGAFKEVKAIIDAHGKGNASPK